eukprot:scaffold916_cov516-Prasinococcus_capsulatus_cf.AAC.27
MVMTAEQIGILYAQICEHAQLLQQVFLLAKTKLCFQSGDAAIEGICDCSRLLISQLLTVRDYSMARARQQEQPAAESNMLTTFCRPPHSVSRTTVLMRANHAFDAAKDPNGWSPTIISPMRTVLDAPCLVFAPELVASHSWTMPSSSTTDSWMSKVEAAGLDPQCIFLSTLQRMPSVPRLLVAASLVFFNADLLPQIKHPEVVSGDQMCGKVLTPRPVCESIGAGALPGWT